MALSESHRKCWWWQFVKLVGKITSISENIALNSFESQYNPPRCTAILYKVCQWQWRSRASDIALTINISLAIIMISDLVTKAIRFLWIEGKEYPYTFVIMSLFIILLWFKNQIKPFKNVFIKRHQKHYWSHICLKWRYKKFISTWLIWTIISFVSIQAQDFCFLTFKF